MRKIAFLSTVAALLFSAAPVAAENDFDALLGDLTFSDTPASGQALTLDAPAEKVIESLKPVQDELSSGISMPPTSQVLGRPAAEPISPPVQAPAPIQPDHVPAAPSQVDFGQAFAAQECDSCGHGGCASEGCGDSSLLGNCGGQGAKCETCVPYHQPRLPSSSFYQAFRSDACNVDVWNGFRNRCCYANEHTAGTCDCFNSDGGCGSCETQIYEVAPCEPKVCAVPSMTRAKQLFDFRKRTDCDDQAKSCESAVSSCDAVGATCD